MTSAPGKHAIPPPWGPHPWGVRDSHSAAHPALGRPVVVLFAVALRDPGGGAGEGLAGPRGRGRGEAMAGTGPLPGVQPGIPRCHSFREGRQSWSPSSPCTIHEDPPGCWKKKGDGWEKMLFAPPQIFLTQLDLSFKQVGPNCVQPDSQQDPPPPGQHCFLTVLWLLLGRSSRGKKSDITKTKHPGS